MILESLLTVLVFVGFLYFLMRFGCGAHIHRAGCAHETHVHDDSSAATEAASHPTEITRDPVCGMEINTDQAFNSAEYNDVTYYFCSAHCCRQFLERPAYFAEIDRVEHRYIS